MLTKKKNQKTTAQGSQCSFGEYERKALKEREDELKRINPPHTQKQLITRWDHSLLLTYTCLTLAFSAYSVKQGASSHSDPRLKEDTHDGAC